MDDVFLFIYLEFLFETHGCPVEEDCLREQDLFKRH